MDLSITGVAIPSPENEHEEYHRALFREWLLIGYDRGSKDRIFEENHQ